MKKIASLFFCVLTFSSFSLGQPLVGDLYFTSLKIDSVQMPKACEMYSSYFLSDSSSKKFNEDCSSDSEGIGFHSLLDSTVFIYFRGDEKRQYLDLVRAFQNCVGPYPEDSTVGTPGTHQFSEVMMFELLRFQECGIIQFSEDSLKKLQLPKGSPERNEFYRALELKEYPITDDFPRVTPESFVNGCIPPGVTDFKYSINLSNQVCQPFCE